MDKLEILQRFDDTMSSEVRDIAKAAVKTGLGTAVWVAPDKDPMLFNLYLQGYDHEEIAAIVSLPVEMIALTALRYRWAQRVKKLGVTRGDNAVEKLLHTLVDAQLTISCLAIQEDLRDIAAGKMKASDSKYVAKNTKEIQILLNSVAAIHALNLGINNDQKTQVNVQVVNNAQLPNTLTQPTADAPALLTSAQTTPLIERLKALDARNVES